MDFTTQFKPTSFDEMIGHKDLIELIKTSIRLNTLPKLCLFQGQTGIGKSCLAEIVARELVKNECDNYESKCIKKYNMATMVGKRDIIQVLDDIFKFKTLFGKTVYILEEVQILKQKEEQTPFLEELTKIPEDVYIFMCTTNPNSLLPALRNRAISFQLNPPSKDECMQFINTILTRAFNSTVPENISETIAIRSDYSPRSILKHLQLLYSEDGITQERVNSFFSITSQENFIFVLDVLFDYDVDLYRFVKSIENVSTRTKLNQLVKEFKRFVLKVLIEVSASGATSSLTRNEKSKVMEVLKKAGRDEFTRFVDIVCNKSTHDVVSVEDAKYFLVELKLKFMKMSTSKIVNANNSNATKQKMTSIQNTKKIDNKKLDKTSHFKEDVKELTFKDIGNITGNYGL